NAAARNIISGNSLDGLILNNASNCLVQGNYFGTDAVGATAISNGLAGIDMFNNPNGIVIGGSVPGAGNVISGNAYGGIFVNGGNNITLQGNYIGTDASGSNAVPNTGAGIVNFNGTHQLTLAANIVSGNRDDGIYLEGTKQSVVQGNFIGINAAG